MMDAHHRLMFVCFAVTILLVETLGQCPEGYFFCDKGRCISSERVCNGQVDCRDQTDETGCEAECPEDYFKCDSDRCLSSDKMCNGELDCKDQTDEMDCETGPLTADATKAVVKAARYLLSQRSSETNWGEFTPRAIVALSLAQKYVPAMQIPEKEKLEMTSIHNRQLLLLLREGVDAMPLHTLSLHINALYAICSDPRNFNGIDLVQLLRYRADKAIGSSDFSKPGVLLTLCISKSSRLEDFELLLKLYDKRIQTTATKALVLMSMASCNRQVLAYEYEVRVQDFATRFGLSNSSSVGSYTLGLTIQALNAWALTSPPLLDHLLTLQLKDGSFQDLLGTYTAIPALLGASLADCKCAKLEGKAPGRPVSTAIGIFTPHRHIDLSISIESGDQIGRHTLRISFEGRKSLFDLMKAAELQNSMFRFTFEVDGFVKKVTSLAGISNDAESGMSWELLKVDQKSTKDLVQLNDIESIFPEDDEHYIFQLQ